MQPSLSPRLTPRIVVDQTVALYDAPISIALEGFEPRTRVTVTATFVHYTGGGSPRANSEAGADAWRHVLAFLEESTRFHR